jgi:hypothetical protein
MISADDTERCWNAYLATLLIARSAVGWYAHCQAWTQTRACAMSVAPACGSWRTGGVGIRI